MDITARPWTTAGFALHPGSCQRDRRAGGRTVVDFPALQTRVVQLVSGDVSWDQVLQTALANGTDIYDHLAPATFADIQQFAANVPAYLEGSRSFETDLGLAYTAAIHAVPADRPRALHLHLGRPHPQQHQHRDVSWGHLFDIPAGQRRLLDILTNGLSYDIGICPICTERTIDVLPLLVGDDWHPKSSRTSSSPDRR